MIEHVAFLGSKKRGKLLRTGARSNAYTDFHHTVFHIHSPTSMQDSDEDLLPFVLDALNEIAFYPNFLTSRIEKERRAILSELQMMNSIEYRVDCLLLQHLHSENKLSKRFPIGLEEQIKKWDAEKIWKFNERWYFPANATLLFGQLCPELQHVELTGLHRITDDGFTQLIECCEAGLEKIPHCVTRWHSSRSRLSSETADLANENNPLSDKNAHLQTQNCFRFRQPLPTASTPISVRPKHEEIVNNLSFCNP